MKNVTDKDQQAVGAVVTTSSTVSRVEPSSPEAVNNSTTETLKQKLFRAVSATRYHPYSPVKE